MQLNLIALVLVLMVSGLVPLRELLFVVFASAYYYLFAKYVFPCPTKEHPPSVFPKNKLLGYYVGFAGLIAIPTTVAYILGSFVKGDQVAMKAASPHLFLIACQVLTEIAVVKFPAPVSLPVRMMVPVSYNTRRMFTISAWLETEFTRTSDDSGWLLFGRALAIANMAIWAFNLLCFLLPVYFPLCMRKHSEMERLASKKHQT